VRRRSRTCNFLSREDILIVIISEKLYLEQISSDFRAEGKSGRQQI